jgi:hypothetical protein
VRPTLTLLLSVLLVSPNVLAWDDNRIDTLWRTDALTELSQTLPGDGFERWYGYYRLGQLALERGDKRAAKDALYLIRDELKGSYQTPDQAALYAATLGLSIGLKPWQAIFIAGKAETALVASEALSDNHAPTAMVRGIGLFNTPALMGGDKAVALDHFNRALTLYDVNEAWGMEDAWLWQIKALLALDRRAEAEASAAALLTRYPDFSQAKSLLD